MDLTSSNSTQVGTTWTTYDWALFALLPALLVVASRCLLSNRTQQQSASLAADSTKKDEAIVATPLVAATPSQVELTNVCSRDRDILQERDVVALSPCNEDPAVLKRTSSFFRRRTMTTLRLPLDACSDAAAEAIEASSGFPDSFDIAASGGGLLAFYGGAVTSVLGTLARRGVIRVGTLHGVSSGALICSTFLGVESGFTRLEDVYRCYQIFARSTTGLGLSKAMRVFLDECLPPDIHVRASGRMHVTVTEIGPANWYVPTRRVISTFATRDEFLDTVMASTIIPGLTSLRLFPPSSRPGAYWMDGAVIKMPHASTRPEGRLYLQFNQLRTLARLGYWPLWILLQKDHDFDVSLALPALKDVVRLFAQGERLPWKAMNFTTSSAFPL